MEEVSRALVDAHRGDATQALLALARAAGIAVAYLDRRCLELLPRRARITFAGTET